MPTRIRVVFNRKTTIGLASTYAKTQVPDRFPAETLFQFPQDVDLCDLLELVMKRRLQNAHVKHAFAQSDWCRMRSDKIADDFAPGVQDFGFMKTFLEPESLHQFRQNI